MTTDGRITGVVTRAAAVTCGRLTTVTGITEYETPEVYCRPRLAPTAIIVGGNDTTTRNPMIWRLAGQEGETGPTVCKDRLLLLLPRPLLLLLRHLFLLLLFPLCGV